MLRTGKRDRMAGEDHQRWRHGLPARDRNSYGTNTWLKRR
jgi:hypothetical protein